MSNPYGHSPYSEPQNPYVQSSPYGAPMAQSHPQGTIILVLGILSLVGFSILGPIAWIMGNKAIKEIDANPAAYSDRGNVNAGRITGMIGSILLILGVLAMIAYVIFFILLIGASATY